MSFWRRRQIMQRRKVSRRVLLRQAAGAATASLLPMPAIAETRQVKFTLSWLATGSFAFVYAAQAKEFMKKRGIDMSIARGFGSFATAQSIAAGAFDCGLSAVPAVALSVAKGLPLISLATRLRRDDGRRRARRLADQEAAGFGRQEDRLGADIR
jgi:ABC-type nitrate/sulfonate/bicarbonate transport system substrate-binding protein